jgi:hypothetical protein
MLTIPLIGSARQRRLILDGKLIALWADELRSEYEEHREIIVDMEPNISEHGGYVTQWGKPTVTRIWEEQILERLVRAALLCGQLGVLCTLIVGLLNVVAEGVELVAKKTKNLPLMRLALALSEKKGW